MIKIWNRAEISIKDEAKTTSVFAQVILEVLDTPVGVGKVKKKDA